MKIRTFLLGTAIAGLTWRLWKRYLISPRRAAGAALPKRHNRTATGGYYVPSLLRLQVDTTNSLLNVNQLSDAKTEAVYLHEYCHFIQNVTTNCGLRHFYVSVNYLKFATHHIMASPPGTFPVPVNAVPAANNVYANQELWKLYTGDGDAPDAQLTSHQLLHVPQHGQQVPLVVIGYVTPAGKTDTFAFGEHCISESMAYLLERSCYPATTAADDLPYHAAEKVVELLYPAFGQNPLNVLALCDASLKAFNPGPFFYHTLLRIKARNLPINVPEDVYAICNQASIHFNGARTFNSLLPVNAQGAIQQLHDYFNDTRFDSLKLWLAQLIQAAVAYRQQHEPFPLAIARGGPLQRNRALAAFMHAAGTPLTTNLRGELSLADPGLAVPNTPYFYIWAIEEVQAVLTSVAKRDCQMVHFCRNSGVAVDRRCSTAPWTRTQEPGCAFGQMWRHWGLEGYSPALTKPARLSSRP